MRREPFTSLPIGNWESTRLSNMDASELDKLLQRIDNAAKALGLLYQAARFVYDGTEEATKTFGRWQNLKNALDVAEIVLDNENRNGT